MFLSITEKCGAQGTMEPLALATVTELRIFWISMKLKRNCENDLL